MTWYIYENWTHDRVRIHKGECGYCQHGRGTQSSDSGRNGKWHKDIPDRSMAFRAAKQLNRTDTKFCASCG